MWSAPRRRLGRTSPWASRQRSSGPSNWICRSCWESRYRFCVWKSTRRGYRWGRKKRWAVRGRTDARPATETVPACSSANCGDVHPPAFDPDEPKTRLRNEPNLTRCFQQELRTKAGFHPQRRPDSPADGCIRVQPDATRSQILRMLRRPHRPALCAKVSETPSLPGFSVEGGEGNAHEEVRKRCSTTFCRFGLAWCGAE